MNYWIQAVSTGHCLVRNYITYQDVWDDATTRFELWIWVVLGGDRPILVDTGPRDLEPFNRATQEYIPGGIRQRADERTPAALRRHGVDPEQVSHVVVTHLHPDHYEFFDAFANAQLVVNRREFHDNMLSIKPRVMRALADRWPGSLRLVDDEEIVPGIRTFRLGCHSSGSQAVAVETARGTAVITGDVVYLYRNIEEDLPINSENPDGCRAAMQRIREEAAIVLPAHDPSLCERFPGGIVGAASRAETSRNPG